MFYKWIVLNSNRQIFFTAFNKKTIQLLRHYLDDFFGGHNNKIVAYGSIVVENKIRGEVAGHIEDIVVDNSVRGKMLGVKLVKELVEIGKNFGCYRITLFCDKKLIKFYEKNGFKVNNVIMKKYLN